MTGEVLTVASSALGAFAAQLAYALVISPVRERRVVEEVADRAAAKAIAAHEGACVARNFVGPVADSNGG